MSLLPRVRITCPEPAPDGERERELPFVVGIVAGLSGRPGPPPPRFAERRFVDVSRDSFEALLAAVAPSLALRIAVPGGGEARDAALRFRRLEDFEPAGVARQAPWLPPGLSRDVWLDAILHAPEFQALESSWRSLHWLVSQFEPSENLKFRVLDATRDEIREDLMRAPAFDQSFLFKRVHDDVFGSGRPEPFGALLGDFEFGPKTDDVAMLEGLAFTAAAIHAPFLAGAAPSMFAVEAFGELAELRRARLDRVMQSGEFPRWRRFRESEESRYVVLAMPRVLARPLYGSEGTSGGYRETARGDGDYLWANPCWALARNLAHAFDRFGWCGAITGVEGGGLVTGLPVREFGDFGPCCTIFPLDDTQEHIISRWGFASLTAARHSDCAVFFRVPSCHKPRLYDSPAAAEAAVRHAEIPLIVTASRFVHYLRVLVAGWWQRLESPLDCERFLRAWLAGYQAPPGAPPEVRVRQPLFDANCRVREHPGRPGAWDVAAFLGPEHQVCPPPVALRLTFPMPPVKWTLGTETARGPHCDRLFKQAEDAASGS